MTEFTFGNPATISLSEAMRRRAVDILKGLAERLDVAMEVDYELDIDIAQQLLGSDRSTARWALEGGTYTGCVGTALSLVDLLYPSLVIFMCRCADGSINIREAWDAEDDMVEVNSVRGGRGGLPVLRCLVAAMIKRIEVA